MVTVRPAGPDDVPFLLCVLAVAADWREGVEPRAAADVLASPDLAHYLPEWTRTDDRGLVAEHESEGGVGAAWWRYFDADDPGYGFVAADVPEIAMGVLAPHRGGGLGTRLLRELIALARSAGLPALSLSVEPDNAAMRLYARNGFVPVGTHGGAVTMLLRLQES